MEKTRKRKNRKMLAAIAAKGTMGEVAELAGLSINTISSWVNHRHPPTLDRLQRLAKVVEKTVDELLD